MHKLTRLLFLISGFFFVGLGVVGAILPGLPTVVFMIIALACFAKSSQRFHSWLYNHRIFGTQLQLWEKYKVIPPLAKIAALGSMFISSMYLVFFSTIPLLIVALIVIVMLMGAYYIITKPSYPPSINDSPSIHLSKML